MMGLWRREKSRRALIAGAAVVALVLADVSDSIGFLRSVFSVVCKEMEHVEL